ncbi:hybrid sensor histidine kinase/response regulator [Hyphomonas sp. FCG-A18]|uniref:hybrid sensor histidine kinase/response regulator n=1 Tax=Hyphomonas sp. FCG-A18 TaxID=3080019 RepID=UPI002B2E5EE3|nr:hybrid sensor histidine kinase/response regulator [Hyphomonas sp. FCG-A18]
MKLARFIWQMHIISALVLWVALKNYVDQTELTIWAVWMTVWGLSQGWISFRGSRDANNERPLSHWAWQFDLTAIMAAIGYGWLAYSLTPSGNEPLSVFVGFIISGGILTGTGTHNMHYRMLVVTLLIIIPAQAARTWVEDIGGQGATGAAMLFAFLGLMLGLGWVLRSFTRRGFILQWEKSELADALAIARAEAEDANLAKSRFLAQASHDLRQPVHSMGLFLASLEREQLSDAGAMLTHRLTQSVDVLSKLFNSLLDVTLLDSGKLEPSKDTVDLKTIVGQIVEEFRPAADAEACSFSVQINEIFVLSDPILLRRIIQNLISNAIRHGEGDILISSEQRQDVAFVAIQDSGAGIDAEDAQLIFEAFERPGGISDSAEGLGLGLAIVRRLCSALGTNVSLDLSADQGARFIVGPLQIMMAPDFQPSLIEEKESFLPNGRVLVVDDDPATLQATSVLLSNWGWDISAHTSTAEITQETFESTDLLVTDYELGHGVTGLDVVTLVQSKRPACPAIVISGNSTDAVRKAVESHGILLLLKPVRPAQLRSAILSLIGR